VPYADFVTLLFAFFTALYAVTAVDATRLPTMAAGLREAMGTTAAADPAGPAIERRDHDVDLTADPPAALPAPPQELPSPRVEVEQALAADLAAGRLELTEDRRGLVLAVPEAFAFDTGRDDLSPVAEQLMARVAAVLKTLPNAVRVEGHTDDTPIRTARFTSNWDLSTARATRVVAFFITTAGLAPTRLSAAGYSEFHPRAGNDTAEGRARNRRVDIVILNQTTAAAEEPVPGGPTL
jgi:chemotaxis protein MotB